MRYERNEHPPISPYDCECEDCREYTREDAYGDFKDHLKAKEIRRTIVANGYTPIHIKGGTYIAVGSAERTFSEWLNAYLDE